MTEPGEPTQVAVVAAMLDAAAIRDDVGDAVYAEGQAFDDAWPRHTIEIPQVIRLGGQFSTVREIFVTLHSWARGADASLVVQRIAGRLPAVLAPTLEIGVGPPFAIAGHQLKTWEFQGARPTTDPDPKVAHVVSTFRYLTQPA